MWIQIILVDILGLYGDDVKSIHRHGHTLDLIITLANTTLNTIITSSHIVTSDHYPILTSINVSPNPPRPPTTFTYRRINAIDYPKFIDNLNLSSLITNPPSCLPDLLVSYIGIVIHNSIITLLSSPNQINPLALLPLLDHHWNSQSQVRLPPSSTHLHRLTLYFRP